MFTVHQSWMLWTVRRIHKHFRIKTLLVTLAIDYSFIVTPPLHNYRLQYLNISWAVDSDVRCSSIPSQWNGNHLFLLICRRTTDDVIVHLPTTIQYKWMKLACRFIRESFILDLYNGGNVVRASGKLLHFAENYQFEGIMVRLGVWLECVVCVCVRQVLRHKNYHFVWWRLGMGLYL